MPRQKYDRKYWYPPYRSSGVVGIFRRKLTEGEPECASLIATVSIGEFVGNDADLIEWIRRVRPELKDDELFVKHVDHLAHPSGEIPGNAVVRLLDNLRNHQHVLSPDVSRLYQSACRRIDLIPHTRGTSHRLPRREEQSEAAATSLAERFGEPSLEALGKRE